MRASSRLKRADPACAARGKTPGGSRVMLILHSLLVYLPVFNSPIENIYVFI